MTHSNHWSSNHNTTLSYGQVSLPPLVKLTQGGFVEHALWQLTVDVTTQLSEHSIPYTVTGPAGLALQGVAIDELAELTISIQWDQFPQARALLASTADIDEQGDLASFSFERAGFPVRILCFYNWVVTTDPDRIALERDDGQVWVQSVLAYRRRARPDDPLVDRINQYLKQLQSVLNQQNAVAWTENPYHAWVNRFGLPEAAARTILKHPKRRLASLLPHLGAVRGRRIVNLMGSHGSKAVALALLGAQPTVVDVSPENARYARELAESAGVGIRYVVSDVLDLPPAELTADYDLVFMELGILHYFVDLNPLFQVVGALLQPGGRFVLQEFHPISTKLITSKGKKHKVTGNYFDSGLVETAVAYSGYLGTDVVAPKVRLRKWTLGEVVTAVAGQGLYLRTLEEEPNHKLDDMGLPKTFTLVAEKL